MKNQYIKDILDGEGEIIKFAEKKGYKNLGPTWNTFKRYGLFILDKDGYYYYGGDSEQSYIDRGFELININYKQDGNKICATYSNFINLQETPAGFGNTEEEAKTNLLENDLK